MSDIPFISFDKIDGKLSWSGIADAILAGHKNYPQGQTEDSVIQRGSDTLLSRSAWIDGLGMAIKVATVFPNNTPSIDGGMMLFDDTGGHLRAVLDFKLVTKWKTVGDSILAARQLARPDSQSLLVVGGGTVADNLIKAYREVFDLNTIYVWTRRPDQAMELAQKHGAIAVENLRSGVERADMVTCATMANDPVIKGDWLQAGQHIDLIGAYRADMREVDDIAMQRARIFVDARGTTIDHIGELMIPIKNGSITADDVIADYYDIVAGKFVRHSDDDITLFKNGGGAHLDLMVANAILDIWQTL